MKSGLGWKYSSQIVICDEMVYYQLHIDGCLRDKWPWINRSIVGQLVLAELGSLVRCNLAISHVPIHLVFVSSVQVH